MDKLGKIHRHHWKERLKISKIAKFESASLRGGGGGQGGGTNLPPTVRTFVNFRDFAERTVKHEISLISCPYIGISK